MTAIPTLSTNPPAPAATARIAGGAGDTTDNAIDTTPISPTKDPHASQTTAHLAHHLSHRPDATDLKNRHILLYDTNNTSPAIQQAAHELERQRAADALKSKLGKRPEKDELVERNILPEGNVAPALLAHQKELERHMRKDSLDRQLQGRPDVEKLIQKGILNEDEDPRE